MNIKNTDSSYGIVTKFLHWSIAFLILTEFSLVYYKRYILPEKSPTAGFLIGGLHKPLGIVILTLVVLAFIWRLSNPKPSYSSPMPLWQKLAASIIQFFLYVTMFAMPISGITMSILGGHGINFFDIFQISGLEPPNKLLGKSFYNIHEYTSYFMLACIAIHIGAALKHHFIDKNTVLKRML